MRFNCRYGLFKKLIKSGSSLPVIWQEIFELWCKNHYQVNVTEPGKQVLMFNSRVRSAVVSDVSLYNKLKDIGVVTVDDFLREEDVLHARGLSKELKLRFLRQAIPRVWTVE